MIKKLVFCILLFGLACAESKKTPSDPIAPTPTPVPIVEQTPPAPDLIRQMTDEEMERVTGPKAGESDWKGNQSLYPIWLLRLPQTPPQPPALMRHR